jgi:hypothetical protein
VGIEGMSPLGQRRAKVFYLAWVSDAGGAGLATAGREAAAGTPPIVTNEPFQ